MIFEAGSRSQQYYIIYIYTKIFFIYCRVYFLDIPNDSVIERLTMRATDPVSGKQYNLLYNPPLTVEVKERLQVTIKL